MSVIRSHWLQEATKRHSPHFDSRPNAQDISLIVIHCISLPEGQYGTTYVDDLFMGTLDCRVYPCFSTLEGMRVSAHCFIRRDGQLIQYVPFHQRAWHAGESVYKSRENCNDFSIGIELEGCIDDTFTQIQYLHLARLINSLRNHYISLAHADIVSHSHIAPTRKQDPGKGFDWNKIHALLD